MCTLLILRHVHPEWPLILAANRDELYARPSAPAQRLASPPALVAGLDEVRGGTWMGVTETGFFAGLTNQRGAFTPRQAPASRGEVVKEALRLGSIEAVERYLEGLDPASFNPFNLLYGDAHHLRVAYARPASEQLTWSDVPPGLHVLPNDVLDAPGIPKVARARLLAEASVHRPWPELVSALQHLMADHTLPLAESIPEPPADSHLSREQTRPYQALCIHTPAYGTRSSAIVALAPGRVAHFLASDEPPCQHAFRDLLSPPSRE
ncbi:NRDE family protein [Stigmatella sp. ncwal1]|uniref:NRDE family protein n=1 Tax=Stigmatella ashevillensis TaxID=2995309 RepID=A0ABT5D696_9BACT|nr:NRDE family protein [Stigmatella ashevillena]MDC0708594.1 NRDE family protein [Stigmatella ashevillena]